MNYYLLQYCQKNTAEENNSRKNEILSFLWGFSYQIMSFPNITSSTISNFKNEKDRVDYLVFI